MAAWIGYGVSVNCGEPLGCYQGTILEADGDSITLTKAFRNGFPYPKPQVTIKATDIKNLKIIETKVGSTEKTHSTVAVTKPVPRRAIRSTVSDNLQIAGGSNAGGGAQLGNSPNGHHKGPELGQGQGANSHKHATGNNANKNNARSKPIDIQNKQNRSSFTITGQLSHMGNTPNKKDKVSRKNEACFGTPSDDPILNQDFDFEKNLALFDKQALWEVLNQAQKPDVVRQTDQARRLRGRNYRHDENIIPSADIVYKAIIIPESGRGIKEYVTDEGLIVQSVTCELRTKVLTAAGQAGLTSGGELAARAGCDTALRLLGGAWRLDPRNAHQQPTVTIIVGPHRQGAVGVTCARHLASHGVITEVLVSGADVHGSLQTHLNLYQMTGNKLTTTIQELSNADLIILALCEDNREPLSYHHIAAWVKRSRAHVLALDPPSCGTPGIDVKYSLISVLPLSYAPENGKLYLCNLSIPKKIFTDLGIQYRSPFGSKTVIALHPSDS